MSFAPPQSLSSKAQDRILGLFVLLAVLLALGLFVEDVTSQRSKWAVYHAQLSSSFGLGQGAPVRLNGVTVGRIESLNLTENGAVSVTLFLQKEHQQLYRQGSHIKIDSSLDIDSVLSGTGVVFIPGKGGLLKDGATLPATEPKSLDVLIEEWDVETLTRKVGDILDNLDSIVSSVNANQDALSASLQNVADLTTTMAKASEQLPMVLTQMQTTMSVMQTSLTDGKNLVESNMASFQEVAHNSNELIATLNTIATQVEPATADLPETQALLSSLLWEVNGLTQQLRQHWLLQSTERPYVPDNASKDGLFPPDNTLYQDENVVSEGVRSQ